jgi:RimJ/RimL family protein N-acetyltransferase
LTDGAGPYRVMPRPELTEGGFAVRAVEPEHIEPIRQWRNAQIDVLRQSHPIAPDEQVAYFARTIWPDKALETPTNILLIILEDGVLIGYGGLVHIAWCYARAEISFLLDPVVEQDENKTGDIFASWLRLLKRLAFEELGLTRLTTETYAMRALHIRVLEENGFVCEGRLREHVKVGSKPMDALLHSSLLRDNQNEDTT